MRFLTYNKLINPKFNFLNNVNFRLQSFDDD